MAEENNIGASRLLGTNGLQQAVDSLTVQVGKMSGDVGRLVASMESMAGTMRGSGGSSYGGNWNAGSNSSRYGTNGGGARFSGVGRQSGMRGNGGGGSFGSLAGGSRLSAGIGAAMAAGGALINYANRNMSSNMVMDYAATQSMANGGWGAGGQAAARQLANAQFFQNRYGVLSAQDAAQAAAITQYTYGNSQFGGVANPTYMFGRNQVGAFSYANPTLGATAAAQAAQQTFSQRGIIMGRVLGLNINPNGSMTDVAQQIYRRTFNGMTPTQKQFSAAVQQGGSLNVNLQYLGQQLGLSQTTLQEYQGIIQGQVNAKANGMSASNYYSLLNQAQSGNNKAAMQLSRATGLNTSMFEKQRDLTDTRLTRQSDILNSLAPAFNKATDAVNQFSKGLTALMQATGLDNLVGTGAGTLGPLSNAAGGFMNTLGMGGGLFAASRLFGGGGGLLGRFGRSSGPLGGAPGSNGAYNLTNVGGAPSMTGKLPGLFTAGVAIGAGAQTQNTFNTIMNKGGGDTASFEHYMAQHPINGTAANKKLALGWLAAHPGARVDPGWLKFYGVAGTGRSGGGSSSVSGGSGNNGASNMGANAMQVIGFAKKELGVPYGWGQELPGKAFDCSGLTQWAYGQAGVKIPRVAADQQRTGTAVSTNNTQPGDLLFVGNPAHHVVMNAGGGQIIEAPHTGANVRMRSLNPAEFDSATRIVNSIGNVTGSQSPSSVTLNQTAGNAGGDIGSVSSTSELANIMAALSGGLGAGPMPFSASVNSTGNSSTQGGTNGSAGNGNGKNDTSSLQAYAKSLLGQYGWSGEWDSFNKIVMSESGWNTSATNASSGAYGIPQALPGSKMSSAGSDWRTNGDTQLRWMMGYIKDRYGDPNQAWSFHQRNNWYAKGAWSIDKDQTATVHQGEMIIPAQQAESIRQVLMNNSFNPGLQRATGAGGHGGSISINVTVSLPSNYSGSQSDANTAGKMIADAIANDSRIKQLQIGQ